MDRRAFLKSLLGATAVAALPTIAVAEFCEETTNILDCGDFIIDLDTQIITVKPGVMGVDLMDMYRKLRSVWSKNDNVPKYLPVHSTDESLELINSWTPSPDSTDVIREGGWLKSNDHVLILEDDLKTGGADTPYKR